MKRQYKILIIIGSVVLAILFIAGILIKLKFFIPFALLANEDKILKRELNNQYINEGYQNWKSVSYSDFRFCIPSEWEITADENHSKITNQNGDLVCYMAVVGQANYDYRYEMDFYEKLLDSNATSIESPTPDLCYTRVGGNYLSTKTVHPEELTFYSLMLQGTQMRSVYMVFPSETVSNEQELTEIAEAIMYSYAFPD